MCFKVKSSLSEVKVVALSELTLLILAEIGCLACCQYLFCDHVREVAGNLSSWVMSKHDVCEDG